MKKIYLDYAATTPVDPRVLKAMLPWFGDPRYTLRATRSGFGNPGSLHSFGQAGSTAVFVARQMIAKELNCHYSEVVFTGSATEANNIALRGSVEQWQRANGKEQIVPRIIISSIEHESVLETAKDLEREGVEVVVIPVSKEGTVDLKKLKAALNKNTVMVSVMYANNEVGSVQPITEIAKIVRNFRESSVISHKLSVTATYPLLHTDAVQAFQYLQCDAQELGVDLLTLSAHKIYGPKGAGALYCKKYEVRSKKYGGVLHPQITGGGQERGLRSGTENVPLIVGFAKAVELVAALREKESERVAKLRADLWKGIKKIFPKAQLNGPSLNIPTFSRMLECQRLPNNLNFYIPKVSGEQLLVALDLQGIAVSSGSACTARSIDPSRVLLAMGYKKDRAKNSVRISLGRMTTAEEIKQTLQIIQKVKRTLA